MKIDIDDIKAILVESLEPAKATEIIKKVQIAAEEAKAEKNETKIPKAKNQFVIVVFDGQNKESGLVCQIPEGEDTGTVLSRISNAARAYNQTKKGAKNPIKTLGEAASVKRKFTKQVSIIIKTPIPVRVLLSNNDLI